MQAIKSGDGTDDHTFFACVYTSGCRNRFSACKPASLAWFRGVVDLALSGTYLFSHFLPLCSCGFGTNEFLWRARGASKLGVLVKGGNYFEALAKLDTVVFDKTGTITKGIFAVDTVVNAEGIEDNILYLAAHLESYSNHPIANSIRTAYGQEVDENRVSQITELPGQGMSGRVDGETALSWEC